MMPKKGTSSRACQLATLEEVIHDLKTDNRIPNLIETSYSSIQLSEIEVANLKEMSRIHEKTLKIPKKLSSELVKVTSLTQDLWANARKFNNSDDLIPALEKIIYLKKCEADCLKRSGQQRYEALLQEFEPKQNNEILKHVLTSLREPLKKLRQKIYSKKKSFKKIAGKFDKAAQLNISQEIAKTLCFDFDSGRIDESLHPFSSGHRTDSRITTRVDINNPLSCISSVMHEVGHALYEQGIPESLYGQPSGKWCSMGFHESQSRLLENQIGRSLPFCEFLYPILKNHFPKFELPDPKTLYWTANEVKSDYIRTESDEVNYNLHILLRYELEEELISGTLNVSDIEQEWNLRFHRDFDLEIKTPNQGFLQDIHWFSGLFGYFPTYSLGNLYAATLFKKMTAEVKNFEQQVKGGQFLEILGWLRHKIHSKGRIMTPSELLKDSTGQPLSVEPLIEYLTLKFDQIYRL